MITKRIPRLISWLFWAMLATLLFPLSSVYAQPGTLHPVADSPLYGNFCTAVGGISLNEDPHADSFTLDVPGTPIRAVWMWSGRSLRQPHLGDDSIELVANGSASALTASSSLSQPDGSRTWHTYMVEDNALTTVQTGSNSYTVLWSIHQRQQ